MEARLTPNPVCFVAPENPPTTAQARTNTPKPSSPQVSKPSSFRLAVNNWFNNQRPMHRLARSTSAETEDHYYGPVYQRTNQPVGSQKPLTA